jgi:hypothetical protein
MKNSLKSFMVYVLDYIQDGHTLTAHLYPVDAANGVIMDGAEDGMMTGLTTTGHRIRVALDTIVHLAKVDVTWRNNQGTRNSSSWGDDVIADHLDRGDRNPATGEVSTPLSSITVNGEEVYRKEVEDTVTTGDNPPGGQFSLFGGLFG